MKWGCKIVDAGCPLIAVKEERLKLNSCGQRKYLPIEDSSSSLNDQLLWVSSLCLWDRASNVLGPWASV